MLHSLLKAILIKRSRAVIASFISMPRHLNSPEKLPCVRKACLTKKGCHVLTVSVESWCKKNNWFSGGNRKSVQLATSPQKASSLSPLYERMLSFLTKTVSPYTISVMGKFLDFFFNPQDNILFNILFLMATYLWACKSVHKLSSFSSKNQISSFLFFFISWCSILPSISCSNAEGTLIQWDFIGSSYCLRRQTPHIADMSPFWQREKH